MRAQFTGPAAIASALLLAVPVLAETPKPLVPRTIRPSPAPRPPAFRPVIPRPVSPAALRPPTPIIPPPPPKLEPHFAKPRWRPPLIVFAPVTTPVARLSTGDSRPCPSAPDDADCGALAAVRDAAASLAPASDVPPAQN